jgi:hypothetical protein
MPRVDGIPDRVVGLVLRGGGFAVFGQVGKEPVLAANLRVYLEDSLGCDVYEIVSGPFDYVFDPADGSPLIVFDRVVYRRATPDELRGEQPEVRVPGEQPLFPGLAPS